MIKLIDILKESKQVGPLYHWTDIYHSYNIINDNFLKGYLTDTFKSQPAISFTRNKNFLQTKPKLRNRPEICFVVDGDKLSNKYKIQPFQDPKIKKDEMEEKVLTDGIDDFLNYVIKIIIPKKRFSPGKSAYDYSPDQYDNKFKGVGGKGFFGDIKNYINWLESKGTSTELKEIKTHQKKRIGDGEHGVVYNVGKNKVIKKSKQNDGFSSDEIEYYKMFNKHPNIFPHIYKLTKDYVIMDKLDSPGKQLMDVYEFCDDINIWREEDYMRKIYNSIKDNNFETFNKILEKSKELNETQIYNTLKKCLNFCTKLYKMFQNTDIDIHLNNIGMDNNNNIKIFDLSIE